MRETMRGLITPAIAILSGPKGRKSTRKRGIATKHEVIVPRGNLEPKASY